MVIDTHIRPALFSPICENKERFEKRCDQMNYHLMKPSSIELLKKQYALAGIEKVFLLPSDCSFETGEPDISNDEIEKIVQCDPTFFVGFASADPRKESAAEELEKAFKFQNLAGLYINTARLHMYPCDERLFVLYDICKKYDNEAAAIFMMTRDCVERLEQLSDLIARFKKEACNDEM